MSSYIGKDPNISCGGTDTTITISDSVTSDKSDVAASSKAVKTVYDKVVLVESTANNALDKVDEVVSGGGVGGTVMAAPEVSAPEVLGVGQENQFQITATPGLNNTTVRQFEVTLTDLEAKVVDASGNTATVSYFVPEDTSRGKPMTFTAVAIDTLGNRSVKAVKKTTTSDSYVKAPVFVSPTDGQTIDPVNVVWQLGEFVVLGGEDRHMASRYRIVDGDGTAVYDSGERTASGELTTWTAAAPDVQGGSYKMQAAFKGERLGWSSWSEISVDVNGIKTPSLVTPSEGSDISHYYITFGTSAFALETTATTDTHVASQYRIRSQDGQSVEYDSGESADLVRHILLKFEDGYENGRTYLLDVRHKGEKLGWSEWSAPVSVRIITLDQFSNEIAFTTAGTYNFTVPPDITQLRVLVVGGGSGGGKGIRPYSQGVGGKGGGIVSARINVTPGAVIPLTVGSVGTTGTTTNNGTQGGESAFGELITATGGANTNHGSGSTNLGEHDELICNLDDTPCSTYKSCKSFAEMSLNRWVYDTSFSTGEDGKEGSSSSPGSNANGTTGSIVSEYGVGGNGGVGWNGKVGGSGGAGGYGGGRGGNGGAGGNSSSELHAGGQGGNGGNGGALGGSGGSGGNGAIDGCGGRGGNGGEFGGNGGNGGSGVDAGLGGSAGYGGNGGSGGRGRTGYNGAVEGGNGAPGGKGCVVVFF